VLDVYQYPKCSTCRGALRWLDAHGVKYQSIDIVESPPTARVLARVLEASGLPIAKLFNTSGQAYREGNYKEQLKTLSRADALAALASNGKLIKRPLLVSPQLCLVGFDAELYASHEAGLRAG
jgi:arsenate reductase